MINKIIYACDYRGVELKKELIKHHTFSSIAYEDMGIDEGSALDYVDISKILADKMKDTPNALGVIICGSGQGVAIALNRFPHVRAVMCRTVEDAPQTREKLNANVICLGSKYCTLEEAQQMIHQFIETHFSPDRHQACVQKLDVHPTTHHQKGVNLIARAVILHQNHILLTTATPENPHFPPNLFFLPGGHIEYNESVLTGLKREIWEEMNLETHHEQFIGALECSWDRKGKVYHELDVVYRVEINGLDLKTPPKPMDHKFHTFVWKPVQELESLTLLPETLKPIVQGTLEKSSPSFLTQMINDL